MTAARACKAQLHQIELKAADIVGCIEFDDALFDGHGAGERRRYLFGYEKTMETLGLVDIFLDEFHIVFDRIYGIGQTVMTGAARNDERTIECIEHFIGEDTEESWPTK